MSKYVKVKCAVLGPNRHKKNSVVLVEKDSVAEGLVKRGLVEYCEEPSESDSEGSIDIDDDKDENEAYFSEEEVNKMKKEDLITYAEKIGLSGLTMEMKQAELADAVNNFIDEKLDDQEKDSDDSNE